MKNKAQTHHLDKTCNLDSKINLTIKMTLFLETAVQFQLLITSALISIQQSIPTNISVNLDRVIS